MEDTTKGFEARQDAVKSANKWRDYSSQQKTENSGTTINVPSIPGVTYGGSLNIGGSTLGQISSSYRQLGGVASGGLSSSSGVAPSVYN